MARPIILLANGLDSTKTYGCRELGRSHDYRDGLVDDMPVDGTFTNAVSSYLVCPAVSPVYQSKMY
jgi:hypothetical protein